MNKYGQRGKWRFTDFGLAVSYEMDKRNMKLYQLAKKVGITPTYLSMILHGERKGKNYIDLIKDTLGLKDGKKNAEKAG